MTDQTATTAHQLTKAVSNLVLTKSLTEKKGNKTATGCRAAQHCRGTAAGEGTPLLGSNMEN